MIEYRAGLMYSFYDAFKKTKTYFDILNAKAQIQKEFKLKSGYKDFKSFEATIKPEQNPRLRFYEALSEKTQSY